MLYVVCRNSHAIENVWYLLMYPSCILFKKSFHHSFKIISSKTNVFLAIGSRDTLTFDFNVVTPDYSDSTEIRESFREEKIFED